ncbi:hypothetical protein [Xanthomonas phage NEB7]|nr:hypothetical protein [Xanthomonas phage NEB7]
MLMVRVEVYNADDSLFREYVMDFDLPLQRHVLERQTRCAMEANQMICTYPEEP